jgi:PTS system mannose-specific IIB component/fructoselysine and glucoselysine-specific PTS system IIB component
MPIVVNRVDDRLIHGQVVVGWGRPLGIELMILVDDQVAACGWEQELYRMAVPPEIELRFAALSEAAAELPAWQASPRRILLLTGDIATMAALHAAAGSVVNAINLGGLHHQPGRRQRLPYLYLTDDELTSLRALEAAGAQITAQDVPSAAPVPLRCLE